METPSIDVIRWVKDHGGLEEARRDFQDAYNRRSELCAALGIDPDTGWSDAMAELDRRLMPEGMEWLLEVWPKWSNGEYCKFGDWWKSEKYGESKPKQLKKLSIYSPEQLREWGQDDGDNFGYEWDFMRPADPKHRPDKAEPPVPEVLDADGVEIREGDTVYVIGHDEPLTVGGFAADGRVLMDFHNDDSLGYRPEKLTHERPDSWERVEDDATLPPYAYAHGHPGWIEEDSFVEFMAKDLVRRCKALAERGM